MRGLKIKSHSQISGATRSFDLLRSRSGSLMLMAGIAIAVSMTLSAFMFFNVDNKFRKQFVAKEKYRTDTVIKAVTGIVSADLNKKVLSQTSCSLSFILNDALQDYNNLHPKIISKHKLNIQEMNADGTQTGYSVAPETDITVRVLVELPAPGGGNSGLYLVQMTGSVCRLMTKTRLEYNLANYGANYNSTTEGVGVPFLPASSACPADQLYPFTSTFVYNANTARSFLSLYIDRGLTNGYSLREPTSELDIEEGPYINPGDRGEGRVTSSGTTVLPYVHLGQEVQFVAGPDHFLNPSFLCAASPYRNCKIADELMASIQALAPCADLRIWTYNGHTTNVRGGVVAATAFPTFRKFDTTNNPPANQPAVLAGGANLQIAGTVAQRRAYFLTENVGLMNMGTDGAAVREHLYRALGQIKPNGPSNYHEIFKHYVKFGNPSTAEMPQNLSGRKRILMIVGDGTGIESVPPPSADIQSIKRTDVYFTGQECTGTALVETRDTGPLLPDPQTLPVRPDYVAAGNILYSADSTAIPFGTPGVLPYTSLDVTSGADPVPAGAYLVRSVSNSETGNCVDLFAQPAYIDLADTEYSYYLYSPQRVVQRATSPMTVVELMDRHTPVATFATHTREILTGCVAGASGCPTDAYGFQQPDGANPPVTYKLQNYKNSGAMVPLAHTPLESQSDIISLLTVGSKKDFHPVLDLAPYTPDEYAPSYNLIYKWLPTDADTFNRGVSYYGPPVTSGVYTTQ